MSRKGTFIDESGRELCSKCGWPTPKNYFEGLMYPYPHYPCRAPYEWAEMFATRNLPTKQGE